MQQGANSFANGSSQEGIVQLGKTSLRHYHFIHVHTKADGLLSMGRDQKCDAFNFIITPCNIAQTECPTETRSGEFFEDRSFGKQSISLLKAANVAWYRRGKVNSELKKYEYAINDMHMALAFENSSSGKRHVRLELEAIMEQSKMANKSFENQQTNTKDDFDCGGMVIMQIEGDPIFCL
eukprot:Gb_38863 [translate_table: standard]